MAKKKIRRSSTKNRARAKPKATKPTKRVVLQRIQKTSNRKTVRSISRPARYLVKPKRTIAQAQGYLKERIVVKATKGTLLNSSTQNLTALIEKHTPKLKAKSSRSKTFKAVLRVTVKWKSKEGKWIRRSKSITADDLDTATKTLLQDDFFNSDKYETKDGQTKTISNSHKKIERITYDKIRESSKATPKNGAPKKARGIRHRK